QGSDTPAGLGSGFGVRPAKLTDNGLLAGLPESQIPRAGATAEGADTAHVLGVFVEQISASKVQGSGSSRLTFMDRRAPTSPVPFHATRALMLVTPSSVLPVGSDPPDGSRLCPQSVSTAGTRMAACASCRSAGVAWRLPIRSSLRL